VVGAHHGDARRAEPRLCHRRALGGRGPKLKHLSLLLLLAGIWVVLIPWLKRPVLVVAEPFGLRLAVLVAAAILFFPPLTLLGMVSPTRSASRQGIEVVGRTAGNLYAVSTVASVAAALVVGFFLIPQRRSDTHNARHGTSPRGDSDLRHGR